jgi:hypothetical protein
MSETATDTTLATTTPVAANGKKPKPTSIPSAERIFATKAEAEKGFTAAVKKGGEADTLKLHEVTVAGHTRFVLANDEGLALVTAKRSGQFAAQIQIKCHYEKKTGGNIMSKEQAEQMVIAGLDPELGKKVAAALAKAKAASAAK